MKAGAGLMVVLISVSAAASAPLINDITTTPDAPPGFRTPGRGAEYPKRFAEIQKKAYPDLAPLVLKMDKTQAFLKARETARAMDRWDVVAEFPEEGALEAVATTKIMRFKDDIVIEVRSHKDGSAVHMRSRSRLGKGDLGANAARIRLFLQTLSSASGLP